MTLVSATDPVSRATQDRTLGVGLTTKQFRDNIRVQEVHSSVTSQVRSRSGFTKRSWATARSHKRFRMRSSSPWTVIVAMAASCRSDATKEYVHICRASIARACRAGTLAAGCFSWRPDTPGTPGGTECVHRGRDDRIWSRIWCRAPDLLTDLLELLVDSAVPQCCPQPGSGRDRTRSVSRAPGRGTAQRPRAGRVGQQSPR